MELIKKLRDPHYASLSNNFEKLLHPVRPIVNLCELAADTIETLQADKAEAIDRINDMLMGDDGQAFKEARKFVDKHSVIASKGEG